MDSDPLFSSTFRRICRRAQVRTPSLTLDQIRAAAALAEEATMPERARTPGRMAACAAELGFNDPDSLLMTDPAVSRESLQEKGS